MSSCCPPSNNILTLKRGPPGDQGIPGINGDPGPTGSIGPLGPKGQTGNKGATGPTGPTGPNGSDGPIGPKGNTGAFEPLGIYYGDYLYWDASQSKWLVGSENITLGANAGLTQQGENAIAVGKEAGETNQGGTAIAIGYLAGTSGQGEFAVAIGYQAGLTAQGRNCIAIGAYAGTSGQADHSIILNATGGPLQADASGFYVAPLRNLESDNNSFYLFYNNSTNEIFYDPSESVITYNQLVIDTSGIYPFPNGVDTVYISGVGGGGGGGAGNGLFNIFASGGGGGSGGSIYKYPIQVIDVSFTVVIGNGGLGTSTGGTFGGNGSITTISYYLTNNLIKTIYLGGGGGGQGGQFDGFTPVNGNGGAGGSVSFIQEPVNANFLVAPVANNTSLFKSAETINAQTGSNGIFIYPFILGSSGGAGATGPSPNPRNGYSGGDCNGFFKGGSGGIGFTDGIKIYEGGGGGAGSIFANGANGGNNQPVFLDGSYGSGGGGGSGFKSGNGGNGRVIIEWY
jgi:hypothetical protein